jgi:hypothetical protein
VKGETRNILDSSGEHERSRRRRMRKLRAITLAAALLAGVASAAAQEAVQVISSVDFEITGMTRESALRNFLSIAPALREGLEFSTIDQLGAFLDRKRQDLVNARVFKSVQVKDVSGEIEDGKVPHAVTIEVVDAFTFFPLPNITYDSNYGWLPDLETHYDNAFGTMTNWYLDVFFAYLPSAERPIDKISIHPKVSNLVMWGLPFTLDMLFDYNESKTMVDDVMTSDYSYYKVNANLSTTFNYSRNMYFRPELIGFACFDYVNYLPSVDINRDYYGLTLTNTLGLGRVDWIGNFRKGYDASVYATLKALDRNDELGLTGELGTTTAWYLPWGFLNYYGRVHGQVAINDEPTGLGSWLRGISDNSMSGSAGAFLNNTLAIDVLPWKGVIDLQVHPFFDLGLVYPTSRSFSASADLRYSAGMDMVIFIDAIANLLLRCTIGMDLGYAEPWEHLEILFNTGFTY